jgi:putative tryptophan/tyrosine transport system substrate-binding protein
VHDTDPTAQSVIDDLLQACARFKFEPVVVRVRRAEELATALDEVTRGQADALYSPGQVFTLSQEDYIIERSLQARLPLLTTRKEATAAGALLSYSTDRFENFLRAAALVDKILRGAKPGDLPVEQPERFRLVVNQKTARAIGVTISPVTLARADKVIE